MSSQSVNTRYGQMFIREGGDLISGALVRYGEWSELEISVLQKFLERGAVVVDGGAYIGTHSRSFLSKIGTEGQLYSFEPNPETFAILERNLTEFENAIRIRAGLSSKPVRMRLVHDQAANEGASHLEDVDGQLESGRDPFVEVETMTLDALGLARLDLLKLDIEGMELDALLGAESTINVLKPVVFCECNSVAHGAQLLHWSRKNEYAVFGVVSPAFNPDNWNACPDNIFGASVEIGLLLCPDGSKSLAQACDLGLHLIQNEDDVVLLMLAKPQYFGEVLSKSRLYDHLAERFDSPRALETESVRELEDALQDATHQRVHWFNRSEEERVRRETLETNHQTLLELYRETDVALGEEQKRSMQRLEALTELSSRLNEMTQLIDQGEMLVARLSATAASIPISLFTNKRMKNSVAQLHEITFSLRAVMSTVGNLLSRSIANRRNRVD